MKLQMPDREFWEYLKGRDTDFAYAYMKHCRISYRTVRTDGTGVVCTRDFHPLRVNLVIEKGVVMDAYLG